VAVKSVIDIDINDAKFKAFFTTFSKYQKLVNDMPASWKKSEAGITSLAHLSNQMTEDLQKQLDLLDETETKRQKNFERERERMEKQRRAMKNMFDEFSAASKNLTVNLAGMATSIAGGLGVGTILSGLIGAGGLFGFDRLAHGVTDTARSAREIGTTPGKLKALQTLLGPYADAGALLQNTTVTAHDQATMGIYSRYGVRTQGRDTADIALDMAIAAGRAFGGTNKTQQALEALNLDKLGFTLQSLNSISQSLPQLEAARGNLGGVAGKLGWSDKTSEDFAKLSVALETAKGTIEASLVNKLGPMAPKLAELGDVVAGTIATFINNISKKDIEAFADAIGKLAKMLGDPKFQQGVANFTTELFAIVDKIAHWMHVAVDQVPVTGVDGKKLSPDMKKDLGFHSESVAMGQLIDSIIHQESHGNPKALSPKGAQGAAQFMPKTAKAYGINPWDPVDARRGAKLYLADLLRVYHNNVHLAIAGYNMGQTQLDKVLHGDPKRHRAPHPNDWYNYIPRETQKYLNENERRLHLSVTTATGSGLVINQAAAVNAARR